MADDRARSFLQMIRRSQRGRLKIYLGYGPGVGKTYQMLSEAHRLKREGIDVVVGVVETHGRPETVKLVEGLEVIPRRRVEYHGIAVDEMDVDAILARKPQVVLIDELAHTNVPASRNDKRYEDVQEILATGVHVITTLNVQHLESLYNTIEHLIGVKVRERLPDAVLAEADVVVNVDLAAEDLQKRLREGNVYPRERIAPALENFFTSSNLEHLRELTLRELASQIDQKRREVLDPQEKSAPDQVMVCLSSRGPNSARLLRSASRLAGRLNRNWYAVYVQTPREDPTVIDLETQRMLGDTLTLANQLGATVFTFKGQDVADTILRFAREYRVGQIVIGKPRRVRWWKRLRGERSVAEELVHRAEGVTITVVDAEGESAMSPSVGSDHSMEPPQNGNAVPVKPAVATAADAAARRTNAAFDGMLRESRVLVLEEPVSKAELLRRMVGAINTDQPDVNPIEVIRLLEQREQQGSTFLNEGVALPHARIPGLVEPQVALAITKAGVLDAPTERPTEVVFLLLSPVDQSSMHLQLLAKVGRLLQDRETRRALRQSTSPRQAIAELSAS